MTKSEINILLIEDNEDDAFLLKRTFKNLSDFNYKLEIKDSIKSGIEELKTNSYNVLLLDLSLPDSSGLSGYNKIKNEFTSLPIIILTGNEDDQLAKNAIHQGVQDFLIKGKIDSYLIDRAIFYAIERKQMELHIRESEQKHRELVEMLPEGIIMFDLNFKIIYASEKIYDMFGTNKDNSFVGKDIFNWISDEEKHHTTFKMRIKSLLNNSGLIMSNEYILLKNNGNKFWGELRATCLLDQNGKPKGFLSIVRDVSERKYMEDSLKQSEERYRNLFELSPDAIAIHSDGKLLFVNQNATNIIGASHINDVIGKSILHFLAVEYHSEAFERLGRISNGEYLNAMEAKFIKFDGSQIDVEITSSLVNFRGIKSIQSIIRDITYRKQTEKQLELYRNNLEELVKIRTEELAVVNKKLTEEIEKEKEIEMILRKSLSKEKELRELKSQFISTASHEFRTPLASIRSSAELIERYGKKWPEEKHASHLEKIKASIDYLTTLLDNVITVNSKEGGYFNYNPEQFDLLKLSEEIIAHLKASLDLNRKVVLNYNTQTKIFNLDPKLIRFIINNLVSNSFKYSHKEREIIVEFKTHNNTLHIVVTDFGTGIANEDIPHLFEPFYRSNSVRFIQGTGLGLTVVKHAVDIQSGQISFITEKNKGTVFTVKIPLN